VDFSRKPGPLSRMNQAVLKERQRAENGGPGTNGERIIGPSAPTPDRPSSRPGDAPTPGDTGAGPEVREGTAPPGGSELSAPVEPAPQDASQERLRIQPETGDQTP
jgi:general secretion pathway protein D